MKEVNVNYRKHVLICSEDDGCWKVGGKNTYNKLREYIIKNDLVSSVLITRTKCLDCCNDVGATVVQPTLNEEEEIQKALDQSQVIAKE